MSGLPASGKTTLARQAVKSDGNSARVNRDDLRAMMFDSVWSGKREQVVIDCEKAIAEVLMRHNMNAIIDDTNLQQRHRDMWSEFAKTRGLAFSAQTVDTPFEECVKRDAGRDKSVGRPVIERLAAQGELISWGDRPIVIVDIDGTLCDGSHRQHLVVGDKKNWTAYFELCGSDTPIEFVIRWVAALKTEHTICLVSGRPDTYQRETLAWLWRHNVEFDHIFMRSGGDKRPDTDVKLDILKLLPKEQIAFAIDDRPRVIKMWREQGIRVIPVAGDCENF